eukprot:TRINITY_DN5979_c0_g1_i1.p1 TRINITY_DN5979_c0_g1~~TRINITY_DN5979_c0_g1_i1.p1  ORF type:complete len:127 (-),score=5.92 TRINITY_DN5979_c0_g1_i1:111-443(-)
MSTACLSQKKKFKSFLLWKTRFHKLTVSTNQLHMNTTTTTTILKNIDDETFNQHDHSKKTIDDERQELLTNERNPSEGVIRHRTRELYGGNSYWSCCAIGLLYIISFLST